MSNLSTDGSRKRTENVQRFTASLGGLLKVESIFIEVIEISDSPEDNLNDLVQEEWNKIDRESISLIIGEHDFSDLEEFDKLIPIEPPITQSPSVSSGPPLAPPPPSVDVPPPPPPAPVGEEEGEFSPAQKNRIR